MEGIDGRWHPDPLPKEPLPPIARQETTASVEADTQELRFSLKEMFLATTVAAVMLALFRSTGIFGAVLSFLSAALVTLLVAPAVFAKDEPRQRLIFDFVWGMVMPIVCLVFDPFVFKEDEGLLGPFGPGFAPAGGSRIRINELAYFAWPLLAGQIATLGMVLAWGRSLRRIAPLLAGVLATGFILAACIGVLLVLPATLGALAFGIGLLGYTPFFTAFAYFRRMRLMWNLAREWQPENFKFLLAGLGIVLCLGLAGLVGFVTMRLATQHQ